jgi:hypothetical protein
MENNVGRVYVDGDEIVAKGYDKYFTNQELNMIVSNIISNYPKYQPGDNFNNYMWGIAYAAEDALNARVVSKGENLKSWNQFPRKTAYFTGQNPMKTGRFKNIHQVFPVARKTRKARKSSRKSRR